MMQRMRIGIVTPAPSGSTYGNRVTAVRWAKILKRLGHRVAIREVYRGEAYNLLIALHARRSYSSIARFRRDNPEAPIILALTGTDIYGDIHRDQRARESLEAATRLVVLQPKALEELRAGLREKTRVIYQSAETVNRKSTPGGKPTKPGGRSDTASSGFRVCVIGHLRAVKDPFRTALAARLLPSSSKIQILHAGGAMSAGMDKRARAEMRRNPRYHWLGEQTGSRARSLLAKSQLFVLSSRTEGGANVLSEAIVDSVPVLASRISGSVGILGEGYSGYFNAGDTRRLAALLKRAENDAGFLAELTAAVRRLAPKFDPAREEGAWEGLIGELQTRNSP
jgi:putative glycosyltransferase (TIGR04348 family)